MKNKLLFVSCLHLTMNAMASAPVPIIEPEIPYEVRIIFANHPFFRDCFKRICFSNQNNPIVRSFPSKSSAFEFVKELNYINKHESIGSNRIFAMLRLIRLSDSEKAALAATTVTSADGKRHLIGNYLQKPSNIYVQQIRPARKITITRSESLLPLISSATKSCDKY